MVTVSASLGKTLKEQGYKGQYKVEGSNKVENKSSSSKGSSGKSSTSSTTKSEVPQTGGYVAGKGFVTSEGKIYPTTNPNFVPSGYTSTTGTQNIYVQGGSVKTPTGESITGSTKVPGTDLTANQIVTQTIQEAVKSGQSLQEAKTTGLVFKSQASSTSPGLQPATGQITIDSSKLTPAIIGPTIKVDSAPKYTELQKSTIISSPTTKPQQIISRPSIVKVQTGSFKDISTGYKEIPTYRYDYVEPQGVGEAKIIPATKEQIKYYEEQQRVLTGKEGPVLVPIGSFKAGVMDTYETIQRSLQEDLNFIDAQYIGGIATEIADVSTKLPATLLSGGNKEILKSKTLPTSEFVGGVVQGIVQDIKERPIENIALIGTGAGLGLATGAVAKGITLVPKIGGYLSSGVKGTALGLGVFYTGKTVLDTAQVIALEDSYSKKGQILGKTAKDLGLVGIGFGIGSKAYKIGEGVLSTRGRKFLETKQGVFPQAPTKSQLALFRQNVIKELGDRPGAFHTTSEKFFGKNQPITPKEGASELPGLYGSTQVSTSFSRISGSGATTESNWLKAIKEYLKPSSSPAIAYLKPKGFRKVSVKYTKTKSFEGQQYVKGKGYANFVESPKEGYADVPGMKTEIEAIFRKEAGDYIFAEGKYYTTIKGVRVPIDVFKYDKKLLDSLIKQDKISKSKINTKVAKFDNGVKAYGGKSSYGAVEPTFYIPISYGKIPSTKYVNYTKSTIKPSSSSVLSSSLSSRVSGASRISVSKSSSGGFSSSVLSSSLKSRLTSSSSMPLKSQKSSKSSISRISYSPQLKQIISIMKPSLPIKKSIEKSLGPGYDVYVKTVRANKFAKLNTQPLTKNRALDVGSYHVQQTLARTFKIQKSGKTAKSDYQFAYIPSGFYNTIRSTLREFKIKQKQMVETPEQFIQKQKFILGSQAEKREIQSFRKMVSKGILGKRL